MKSRMIRTDGANQHGRRQRALADSAECARGGGVHVLITATNTGFLYLDVFNEHNKILRPRFSL